MGSHAEQPRRESIGMKIIILLTVLTTLGFCQRLSPPSNPLTEPPAGQRCAGRNFNGRRCCTPEEPCGSGGVRQQTFGWGPWSDWTACRRVHNFSAGRCRKVSTRKCVGQQCGSSLQLSEDLQEQYCRESDCESSQFFV